jgi:hypothetical protein
MASPFVSRFRSVVETLFGRPLTPQDGYSDEEIDMAQSLAGYELPEALRDFHVVAGRFDPVLDSHNRFYSPGNLSRKDDKLVFCEENQVVVFWGFAQDQGWRTDPPVYQGINNDEIEWYVEAGRISEFLVGMIYWQALWGGLPHFRFAIAPESVRQAAEAWPLVLKDGQSQLFSRGSSVFCLTNNERGVEVQAAAILDSDLEELWHGLGLQGDRRRTQR